MKGIGSNKGINNQGCANSGAHAAAADATIARARADTAQGLSNFGRNEQNQ
jgi:hypothetical protein